MKLNEMKKLAGISTDSALQAKIAEWMATHMMSHFENHHCFEPEVLDSCVEDGTFTSEEALEIEQLSDDILKEPKMQKAILSHLKTMMAERH